ncbi:hypothetical protein C8F01DRAFT_953344, partial [Mycena amicta]
NMKLYLPSQLPEGERAQACVRGVVNAEVRLRVGQCGDALVALWACLHTQGHLIYWRNANSVGRRGATRSATLLSRVKERIDKAAAKYRDARAALIALKGLQYMVQFKPLLDKDINARPGIENDIAAMKKLASADSSRASRNEPTQGSLRHRVSWIWSVGGGTDLHDSVRVDWSKAKARRERWREEIRLLREEMKRVLRSLRWEQVRWTERASRRDGELITPELHSGLYAYALRQADMHRRIGEVFYGEWSKPV